MVMVLMVTMKNGEGVVIDGQFKSYGSEPRQYGSVVHGCIALASWYNCRYIADNLFNKKNKE